MIQGDIFQFVKYFERYGKLANGWNSSFISLIQKIKDPQKLSDYRPIYLIGWLYKIFAKILATQLKLVNGQNIDEVQFAYIDGWDILDGPLIVNETCSWAKATKKKVLFLRQILTKIFIRSIGITWIPFLCKWDME